MTISRLTIWYIIMNTKVEQMSEMWQINVIECSISSKNQSHISILNTKVTCYALEIQICKGGDPFKSNFLFVNGILWWYKMTRKFFI